MKKALALAATLYSFQVARAEEGGGNTVVVIGHRPAPPPSHGDPIGRPSRPQPPRLPAPPALTTEQRMDIISKDAFEKAKAGQDSFKEALELWENRFVMEYGSPMEQEEAYAKIVGTTLGDHASGGDTYADAKARMTVKVDVTNIISFRGMSISILKNSVITTTIKTTGQVFHEFIAPKTLFDEDGISREFSSVENAQKGISLMQTEYFTFAEAVACIEKNVGCLGPEKMGTSIWKFSGEEE